MSTAGPQDIEDFERRWSDSMRAADEYARRMEKGLPSDRWSDGVNGAYLVGRGIRALQELVQIQTDYMANMLAENQSRNAASTEVFKDPCRD